MSQPKYRPDIDGLRAVAVGAVMLYHAFPAVVPGGFVGVDVFFVISGYLISGIILDALQTDRFTYADFYARRIRRIFPALAVVLGAVLAVGWFRFYIDDFIRLGRHVAAGAGFIANIVLWRESSYFDIAADLKPLLHLWSLGVEEQFYFVWPLILVIAARWRRGAIAATLGIGAISFAIAIYTVRVDRTAAFFAPWTRFWELLAGAALASGLSVALPRRLRDLQSVLGLLLVIAGVMLIDSTRVFPGLWALLPVAGTALLIASGPAGLINRTILSWRPVVAIGLISYPLYLWHWPLLSFARILGGEVPSALTKTLLLGASVVLATLTYHLVEKPIRFGVHRRAAIPALAGAMVIVCAAGIAIVNAKGFVDRPINRSDAARLMDYYQRMRDDDLGEAYRSECDMLDWQLHRVRAVVAPSCLEHGAAHTIFLWGDSHAQALSLGLRESLPPGTSLAQVATSACRAQIDDFEPSVEDNRCEIANRFAMDAIARLRPDLVILAQEWGHSDTDWAAIVDRIRSLGAAKVLVVGPLPVWQPTLPRVYAEHHLEDRAAYVSDGLDLERFTSDRETAAHLEGMPNVTYVSLLRQLCHDGACLARVGDGDPIELLAVDAGHLSPKGSQYLGPVVWKPLLASLLK